MRTMMAMVMALDPWRLQTGGEDKDEVYSETGKFDGSGEKMDWLLE